MTEIGYETLYLEDGRVLMTQSADHAHTCIKPCYISIDVDDAQNVIRSADNKIILHSECVITDEELEYICEAINFYEKAKLLMGASK